MKKGPITYQAPEVRPSSLQMQRGQAAIEAVLLTLLLALAVFSLVEDSPLNQLIASLTDHQARMARGLALP
jgi:hypothetical protein